MAILLTNSEEQPLAAHVPAILRPLRSDGTIVTGSQVNDADICSIPRIKLQSEYACFINIDL